MGLGTFIGFVAALPAIDKIRTTERVLPTWKRRWYHWYLWDARPIIWSLQNHPEEWTREIDRYGDSSLLLHVPSKHYFIATNQDALGVGTATTRCSCARVAATRFTRGMRRKLWWKGIQPWLVWNASHMDTKRGSTWKPEYEHLYGDARWEAHFVH